MTDWQARAAVVEAENGELRERVRALEEELRGGKNVVPTILGLTRREELLFALLMSRELVTKSGAMNEIYVVESENPPQQKIIDVFVCKLRAKLKPFDITIETLWGRGYCMSATAKSRVRSLLPPDGVPA